MKLIIQIPCLNEEETLPITLKDLPKRISGIDKIEVLIIDDGSTDRTVEVAKSCGVDHIISFPKTKGLARGFEAGLDASLKLGAHIIVNTDGDNQYSGADIQKLIKPILEGNADIVIGDRQTDKIEHFSYVKKKFQKIGSWIVRLASNTEIPDTTSGFRAYSREAALKLNIVSDFTYTLETIIQAGRKDLVLDHVVIKTNGKLRESRLFRSIQTYIKRSVSTIIRIYTMYRPLKVFLLLGTSIFLGGLLLSIRYLFYYFGGNGAGHLQSLILSSILMMLGFQLGITGLLADLIANNRKLLEQTLYRVKKIELSHIEENNSHSRLIGGKIS